MNTNKTQRDLINEGCNNKGITPKEMCDELGINYKGYTSCVYRQYLGGRTAAKIANYLNLDLNLLMNAPLDKPRKK